MKNLNLPKIFKVTRKVHFLGQKEMASQLGISQGTVSKIEKGMLGVDAGLWYEFCLRFNLNPDLTYGTGLIFFKSYEYEQKTLEKFNQSDRIGEFIEVRRLMPFWQDNFTKLIEKKLMLEKIDPDLMVLPGLKVPIDLLFETFKTTPYKKNEKIFLDSSMERFLDSKGYYFSALSSSFSQFINRMKENTSFFKYDLSESGLNILLNPGFKFSLEEKVALGVYLKFEAGSLKKMWTNDYGEKKLKLRKVNEFNFFIEKAI